MANSSPAVITELTGRAWIRNSDGSLTELHQGSNVPAGSDVVTASGATVALQVENGMPIVIGEGRQVAMNGDVSGPLADPSEAAVAAPTGTDSERLLAALQSGQDPFAVLDPTAAVVTGGPGDDGGGSFVRLARILENTTPLDLAYPNPGRAVDMLNPVSGGGGNGRGGDTNNAPIAVNDTARVDEKTAVRGNLLANDSDPDGDPLSIVSINGRPMTPGGVAVTGSNGGTFIVQPDGSYVFVPGTSFQHLPEGQTTTTTISYVVTDPSGATSTATVEVTVVGVNDPALITPARPGEDAGTVKEDEISTANGKLNVVDADDGQSFFVAVADRPGTYGTFSIDAAGNWVYSLNQADPRVQALGVGEKLTETFTVTTADGTRGTVTITINGTNDVPSITGQAAGDVKEDGTQEVTGQLTKHDVDTNDKHTWSVNDGGKGQYGTFTVDQNGKWTYKLDNNSDKVQALAEGQKVTDTITVTVDDGHGGKATQTITVTVTINGTNDAPVISGQATGEVTDGGSTSATGQLGQTDVDVNDKHTWSVNNDGKGQYGSFTVDQNGKWAYKLDNESAKVQALAEGQKVTDTITVTVDDGNGGKATQTITVTITGTNDAAVITPSKPGDDAGSVKEDDVLTTGGKLNVTDKDAGEASFKPQTDFQGQYGKFSIDANGNWTFKLDNNAEKVQALGKGEKLTEDFTVTTADGTTGKVTITINGTNDAPVISGLATGAAKEDGTTTATGQLAKTDVDVNDKHTWSVGNDGKGAYGTFTVDQNGKWTYKLDNESPKVQALADGQKVTDTIVVTVDDGNGGKATQTITVEISGTNDAPTIAGTATGAVKEDGTRVTSGQLTKSDIDTNDTHTWSVSNKGVGTYGTFTVDQNGLWTYKLDNASAKVQALTEGQTVTDKITVTVDDGHGGTATKEITVTITGTNDVATITGQSTSQVIEDKTLISSGKLTVVDADAGQSSVVAQTSVVGKYGTFSIDANGNWTYSLNNSLKAVQDLRPGQVVKENFEVSSADGSAKQTISIDVVGTNDAPVAADNSTSVDAGSSHIFNAAEFNFNDGAEGNSLQSVIITRLPTDGTLTLNGQPVTVNSVISAADIASGKLVYTPSASGQDTSFGFQVRDDGGTANGGKDTSGEYNFALKTNNFISGDKGGTVTTVEPGKNYNIALVIDTSGSMKDASGTAGLSRMQLTIDALKNLANTLKGHDGVVNVTLIGFESTASSKYSINGLNSTNVADLIKAIENLKASGGTNYEGAFQEATKWFNKQPTSVNGKPFENVTYFLTDGDPTFSNSGSNGGGTTTDYRDMLDAVNAFKGLSGKSTVHAIGLAP